MRGWKIRDAGVDSLEKHHQFVVSLKLNMYDKFRQI